MSFYVKETKSIKAEKLYRPTTEKIDEYNYKQPMSIISVVSLLNYWSSNYYVNLE